MICSLCGGHVTWRGPMVALTHTQCGSCGGINCQEVVNDSSEEEVDSEPCSVCFDRECNGECMGDGGMGG